MTISRNRTRLIAGLAVAAAAVLGAAAVALPSVTATVSAATTNSYLPGAKHVFVINLENKGYDETWGPGSAAPYLSTTLRSRGVLLNAYYGTAHNSQPNYVAEISGQGPNPQMQADCQTYSPFVGTGTASPGQAVGDGCVFPSTVKTVADQLTASGRTWKGYMEDMGTPCRHPALGAVDDTQKAKVGDEYAARHNPFVYFQSITGSAACAKNDVDLSKLPTDLASVSTTPNLSLITPNLCDDGHDSPCVDGRPGGLVSADAWLKQWVPKITSSPAFKQDGVLVITFDESDGPQSDASSCCNEGPGPNTALPRHLGPRRRTGRRARAVAVREGRHVVDHAVQPLQPAREHRGHLRLPYLGYAATPGLNHFGLDVYNYRN